MKIKITLSTNKKTQEFFTYGTWAKKEKITDIYNISQEPIERHYRLDVVITTNLRIYQTVQWQIGNKYKIYLNKDVIDGELQIIDITNNNLINKYVLQFTSNKIIWL